MTKYLSSALRGRVLLSPTQLRSSSGDHACQTSGQHGYGKVLAYSTVSGTRVRLSVYLLLQEQRSDKVAGLVCTLNVELDVAVEGLVAREVEGLVRPLAVTVRTAHACGGA